LTPVHREQFMAQCIAYGLSPLKKEIYAVPYSYSNPAERTFSIIIAYEVFLRKAEQSGSMSGWRTWFEEATTLSGGQDWRACIEIKRSDWEQPFLHEVYMSEYNTQKSIWRQKPRTMLKKVVIAQGFRLAFPTECGKLPYIAEELDIIEPAESNPHRFAKKPGQEDVSDVSRAQTPPTTIEVPGATEEPQREPEKAEELAKPDPFAPKPKEDKPEEELDMPDTSKSGPYKDRQAAGLDEAAPPPRNDPEQPSLFPGTKPEGESPQATSKVRLGYIATIRSLFKEEDENNITAFFIHKKYLDTTSCLDDMDLDHGERVVKNGAACLKMYGMWKAKYVTNS